jgi:lectin-like protein
MQYTGPMRWLLVVTALVGCDFPTPSQDYACRTSADCETGRVCETGYCVIGSGGSPDAPPNSPGDASVDGAADAAMPDASNFPQIVAMCMAAGYDAASNGGYYRLPPSQATWVNGEADCANDVVGATHLIVLSNTEEVQIASTEPGWVGLSDRITEGTFVNVTNETPDQRPWAAGQPDNGGGNEDCARIQSNGTLDDDQCGNNRFYACECDGKMPTP